MPFLYILGPKTLPPQPLENAKPPPHISPELFRLGASHSLEPGFLDLAHVVAGIRPLDGGLLFEPCFPNLVQQFFLVRPLQDLHGVDGLGCHGCDGVGFKITPWNGMDYLSGDEKL